jgi:GxxExxY protein
MDHPQYILEDKTEAIIKAFYKVYNSLGYGFLEKVYKNALYLELKQNGYNCEVEKSIKVFYSGRMVGNFYADLVVDNQIILELKACPFLIDEHEAQLMNYLKASTIELGLLLNFGKKPEIKRKICSNSRKINVSNSQ